MKKIVIANCNTILRDIETNLSLKYNAVSINVKEDLAIEKLDPINPDYIFFLHWSYIIPKEIYERFRCIVFHMTDLPYGRGGSPLQNLIVRGHTETMISAIQVEEGIDTGDIYLKKKLSLYGTAEEIFLRAGEVITGMIKEIIQTEIQPVKQKGQVINFNRRKPKDGNIAGLSTIEEVYNYVRMLDAEGYPHAFIEAGNFKFEFTRASLKAGDIIISDVRITKK